MEVAGMIHNGGGGGGARVEHRRHVLHVAHLRPVSCLLPPSSCANKYETLSIFFSAPLSETRFGPKKAIRAMNLSESVAHQTTFALRLAPRVAATAAKEGANVAFSPLSSTRSSARRGGDAGPRPRRAPRRARPAGGAGATADDVAALAADVVGRVLADASAGGGPRVSFANGVWVDASSPSRPRSRRSSPPLTRRRSNPSISKPRLVLGNAIYFKGAWADTFGASGTKDVEFRSRVPKPPSPKGRGQIGRVQDPKFKISYGLDASRVLKEMGVHMLFCGDGGLTENSRFTHHQRSIDFAQVFYRRRTQQKWCFFMGHVLDPSVAA
uniref:Serpin domain-containing protein n=1 Tax=Ananas comosus var. bracteatus TaxID=296719 RepID=A0A6V7NFB8_ANACO|nr:unnamed protein product [Ananas comosus var. bracteatus]